MYSFQFFVVFTLIKTQGEGGFLAAGILEESQQDGAETGDNNDHTDQD